MQQSKNLFIRLFVCASLVTLGVGCDKNDGNEAADLPPASTLNFDIGVLAAAPAEAKQDPNSATHVAQDDGHHENFYQAWFRVAWLGFASALVVILPATGIALAANQKAVRDGDKWIRTVNVGDAKLELEHSVNLLSGWDIDFYVTNSKEGLDRFLWVAGSHDLDLSEGTWTLNNPKSEVSDKAMVDISWTYESDTDRTLTVKNVQDGDEGEDDAFKITVLGDQRLLEFTDADDNSVVADIEWNAKTGAGSIQVPGYNEGNKACWDDEFHNIDCP